MILLISENPSGEFLSYIFDNFSKYYEYAPNESLIIIFNMTRFDQSLIQQNQSKFKPIIELSLQSKEIETVQIGYKLLINNLMNL